MLGCFGVFLAIVAARGAEPGTEVANFALLDYRGEYYELKRSAAGKAVVLYFTATGCPVVRQSLPRLKELSGRFGREGVDFWLVNSSSADDRESIRREAREFNSRPLPVLIDETQGVAALLGVRRTGTAVAIETKTWKIFYRGAIDDQLAEGAQKPAPTEHYLVDALTEFLASKAVSVAETAPRGCLIAMDEEEVSYAAEVAPILRQKCVTCHSPGQIGPFALNSYRKARGMRDMIQEVILARRMPPWHADRHHGSFENDFSLTLDEAKTILRWIEQGAERGSGEDPLKEPLPERPEWALGEPDAIVRLPEVQEIPATGTLDYRYIRAQSPFTEDTWLRGVVAKPDNRRVVHHIIVRVREPGGREDRTDDAFLLGWAPGSPAMFFPEGTGKLIPKGSELEFEMHYTTYGRPEKDQSAIGLYVAEEKPELRLRTAAAYNFDLEVRPMGADQKTSATFFVRRDSMLYDLSPHMHLRGASFKFEALYPTGRREVLLSVPLYDFNWQHNYRLKEPKRLPAGTWILCTGSFDNSARNPNNPDPAARIRWGEQSWDEMFIGFMGIAELPEERKFSRK